jgi:hypothetical protein
MLRRQLITDKHGTRECHCYSMLNLFFFFRRIKPREIQSNFIEIKTSNHRSDLKNFASFLSFTGEALQRLAKKKKFCVFKLSWGVGKGHNFTIVVNNCSIDIRQYCSQLQNIGKFAGLA